MNDVSANPAQTISADGKLIASPAATEIQHLNAMKSGEILTLCIHGQRLLGGKNSETLLGKNLASLDQTKRFKLIDFQPQADGTCHLSYEAL